MVGKPNFPMGSEKRTDLRGAAMTTTGLNALDQEREASMADEGGVSGAYMENQDEIDPMKLDEECHIESISGQKEVVCSTNRGWMLALGMMLGVGAIALFWGSRRKAS
jgi:hypothetical protein